MHGLRAVRSQTSAMTTAAGLPLKIAPNLVGVSQLTQRSCESAIPFSCCDIGPLLLKHGFYLTHSVAILTPNPQTWQT